MQAGAKRITSLCISIMLAAMLFPVSSVAFATTLDRNAAALEKPTGSEVIQDLENEVCEKTETLDDEETSEDDGARKEGLDESFNSGTPAEDEHVEYVVAASRVSIAATTVYNESKFQAAVRGGLFDNAADAKFAVWSEDKGQDDLLWYNAQHMPDGSWAIEAPIANHRSTGRYIVHAYADASNGMQLAAATAFNVSTPRVDAVRLFQLSSAQGTFTVYADGISGAPIQGMRVAVWATMNGQDDLRWYGPQKMGNSYTFGAYMTNHRGQTGTYIADVYVTLPSGLDVFVGRSTANLSISGGSLSYRNDGDRSVTVSCRDGIYGLATGVQYAVWSVSGGQDDLRWYRASRQPDRSWPIAIPVSSHGTAGEYIVHVYGDFPGGMTRIGSTSFTIAPNSAASVYTSLHDNTLGCFLVTVSGVNAPSGVSSVQVPVWTKSNQSDIRWYRANRQSNGDYTVCVQATNHGLADAYNIHVYVTSGNGIQNYVGQASGAKLNLDGFTKVEGTLGSGVRAVWMKNPPANVNYVYVWSSSNGQDDLHCIAADHMGERNWRVAVDCHNLKHAGTCYADIYSGGAFYKRLTFSVTDSDLIPPAQLAMNYRVSGLSSRMGWLVGVDTSNCFVTVYNGSYGNWHAVRTFPCAPGKASTPTKLGVFTVGIKGYVFGHGYSCYYYTQYSGDYLFHSIKYNPGTFDVQDGTMGRPASEGCIRLWIENAKYIYDYVPSGSTVLLY